MKIVVLDGYTLNPGDLSWDGLNALAPCVVHDRTPPASVMERAADAEILLTNKTVLTGDHLRALTRSIDRGGVPPAFPMRPESMSRRMTVRHGSRRSP